MKRWAVLTICLYGVILILLTVPVLLLLGFPEFRSQKSSGFEHSPKIGVAQAFQIYRQWGYWLWLGVLLLGQGLLLFVPMDTVRRRQPSRRRLLIPVLTAGLFFAIVVFGIVLSALCLVLGDRTFDLFTSIVETTVQQNPVFTQVSKRFFVPGVGGWEFVYALLATVAALWAFWAGLFYQSAGIDDPQALTKRLVRRLLQGSILELLVAVPSHVIVRHRDDCCAPYGTFWGICTGLSVMILSFGPGVFFLFVERAHRLRGDDFKIARTTPAGRKNSSN